MDDDCHDFARDRSAAVRFREPKLHSVVSYWRPVGPAPMEDVEMFARKGLFSSIGRAGAVAAVVAMALTASCRRWRSPAPRRGARALTASTGTSDATDFSARRRHYRGGGGAAAAAAFAGIVGTGIAIAATQNRRDYYDRGYYGRGRPITAVHRLLRAPRLLWRRLLSIGRAPLSRASSRQLVNADR